MESNRIGCERLRSKVMSAERAALLITSGSTVGTIETHAPDRNLPFAPSNAIARAIAEHLLEFLHHEVAKGRLPASLLPIRSGDAAEAANQLRMIADFLRPKDDLVAEARHVGVQRGGGLRTERKGGGRRHAKLSSGEEVQHPVLDHLGIGRHVLEVGVEQPFEHGIRDIGDAMNGLIEADIYGNVNSTHIMGSRIQNGIGGSGDFARNACVSIFTTPSTAKNSKISAIVPQASHVDHITQDVQVIVTEHGLADLRGLSPKQRAKIIIENCAHPDYRPALADYFRRAKEHSYGQQSPSVPGEVLSWHQRFIETESMLD
jgi:succinyl-CoA:acetate CoA-transferase